MNNIIYHPKWLIDKTMPSKFIFASQLDILPGALVVDVVTTSVVAKV